MTKKNTFLLILILFVSFYCAKKDKYADARQMIQDMISYQETYVDKLGNAKTADSVIQATKQFSENFSTLKGRIEEISQKYPELKEKKNLPEDLKPLFEKSMQLVSTMGKLMQAAEVIYSNDDSVRKAFEEMTQKMQ